jgi:hypothetical protein
LLMGEEVGSILHIHMYMCSSTMKPTKHCLKRGRGEWKHNEVFSVKFTFNNESAENSGFPSVVLKVKNWKKIVHLHKNLIIIRVIYYFNTYTIISTWCCVYCFRGF